MYSVLNTLSEYTYVYILKNITSYIFLFAFKINERIQCVIEQYTDIKTANIIGN